MYYELSEVIEYSKSIADNQGIVYFGSSDLLFQAT